MKESRNSPSWPFFMFALGVVPIASLMSGAWATWSVDNDCAVILIAIACGAAGIATIAAAGFVRGYDRLWIAFAMVAGTVASVPWAGTLLFVGFALACWGRDPCF